METMENLGSERQQGSSQTVIVSAGVNNTKVMPQGENSMSQKTVWIDIDNSPHVPFFLPIIGELQSRGIELLLTARNTYQVCDLIKYFDLRCKVVGRHYGKN